jgi:hypothetical protein
VFQRTSVHPPCTTVIIGILAPQGTNNHPFAVRPSQVTLRDAKEENAKNQPWSASSFNVPPNVQRTSSRTGGCPPAPWLQLRAHSEQPLETLAQRIYVQNR